MHVLISLACLPLLAVLFSRLPVFYTAVLALVVIVVAGAACNTTFIRLTARMRWIWLSLLLIYTCFTPGELLVPDKVWLPLTYEGVLGGSVQILHLLAMLAWVSVVLEGYSATQLLGGMYQALQACHVPAPLLQRMVARLMLVLEMQKMMRVVSPRMQLQEWLAYFRQPELLLNDLPLRQVTVYLIPLRLVERSLLVLILGLTLLLLIY